MANNIDVSILVNLKDEASQGLKRLGSEASKTGSTITNKLKNNVVGLGVAFGAATGFMMSSIKAFDESEKAAAQLNAVLKSTGGIAGVTAEKVLSLSKALQKESTFSDEAITSAQNLLLTFTGIGKDVFPQAIQTVLDMSTALGQDLSSSSIQLGKALQDPILGVTALRRVGVNFSEAQQEMIKTMVDTGKTLDAQKFILKELATEFGGSAKGAAETFGGQLTILQNQVNDLQETIGKGLVKALMDLTGGFDDSSSGLEKLNALLESNETLLSGVSVAILALVAGFGVLLVAALAATAGISAGVAALGVFIIASIGFAIGVIIKQWDALKQIFKTGIDNIKKWWQNLRSELTSKLIFTIVVNLPNLAKIWDSVKKSAPSSIRKLLGFETGGVVGGPIGEPRLAVVHGGEQIVPHGKATGGSGGAGGNNISLNVYMGVYAGSQTEKRNIAKEMYEALVQLANRENKSVAELLGG